MYPRGKILIIFFILIIGFVASQELLAVSSYSLSDSTNAISSVEDTHSAENLPSTFMVLPFVILLAMIATGPLFYHHFWEKNYPIIAIILGLVTVFYYLFFLNDTHSLLHTGAEYLSFIALLSSLFVASGGILIIPSCWRILSP